MSRINNLDLWKEHDYRDVGIIGEPYQDVDFSKVFYLTDTGRKWNHAGVSIRDRVDSGFDIQVENSEHLIELVRAGEEGIGMRKVLASRKGAKKGRGGAR